ncbi:hypothetical protein KBZ10_08920 [Streptomyces sp. F63]|uniref:hypothetical protein n=1 Tax=Streptomyces sp. F63 TaxID=2824887 RepID=UPI001B37A992|nr:hypothetical protein [Streptomyces sp. F63]MBQ0984635.1 hypothetical protein [Streptomyces sp. F63]
MNSRGWQEVIGAVGIFGMVIVIVTIVVWNMAATWRARAILARDYEYRTLAEKSTRSQDAIEQKLTEIDEHLADLRTRVQSVERVLKEIE